MLQNQTNNVAASEKYCKRIREIHVSALSNRPSGSSKAGAVSLSFSFCCHHLSQKVHNTISHISQRRCSVFLYFFLVFVSFSFINCNISLPWPWHKVALAWIYSYLYLCLCSRMCSAHFAVLCLCLCSEYWIWVQARYASGSAFLGFATIPYPAHTSNAAAAKVLMFFDQQAWNCNDDAKVRVLENNSLSGSYFFSCDREVLRRMWWHCGLTACKKEKQQNFLFDILSIPQTTHFLSCLSNPTSNAEFAEKPFQSFQKSKCYSLAKYHFAAVTKLTK